MGLVGDGGAVVGGEEENQVRNLVWLEQPLERLTFEHLSFVFVGEPQTSLAFRPDAPWHYAIDANVVGAKLVREGTRHAYDGGLCCDIYGNVGGWNRPGNGAQI